MPGLAQVDKAEQHKDGVEQWNKELEELFYIEIHYFLVTCKFSKLFEFIV